MPRGKKQSIEEIENTISNDEFDLELEEEDIIDSKAGISVDKKGRVYKIIDGIKVEVTNEDVEEKTTEGLSLNDLASNQTQYIVRTGEVEGPDSYLPEDDYISKDATIKYFNDFMSAANLDSGKSFADQKITPKDFVKGLTKQLDNHMLKFESKSTSEKNAEKNTLIYNDMKEDNKIGQVYESLQSAHVVQEMQRDAFSVLMGNGDPSKANISVLDSNKLKNGIYAYDNKKVNSFKNALFNDNKIDKEISKRVKSTEVFKEAQKCYEVISVKENMDKSDKSLCMDMAKRYREFARIFNGKSLFQKIMHPIDTYRTLQMCNKLGTELNGFFSSDVLDEYIKAPKEADGIADKYLEARFDQNFANTKYLAMKNEADKIKASTNKEILSLEKQIEKLAKKQEKDPQTKETLEKLRIEKGSKQLLLNELSDKLSNQNKAAEESEMVNEDLCNSFRNDIQRIKNGEIVEYDSAIDVSAKIGAEKLDESLDEFVNQAKLKADSFREEKLKEANLFEEPSNRRRIEIKDLAEPKVEIEKIELAKAPEKVLNREKI